MNSETTRGVFELSSGRLSVDGTPSVVLCSSVFPFRIPRQQWDHRLQLVQESGYGMVDLYVHWGFHEESPGIIDLSSSERDLRHFLDLARDRGLLVMARPGPYICSETDGGGLPWWLHGDAAGAPAALRTTDPHYLEAVDRWFAAVMPILADAQVTRGGAVALVQIENELDFFDCPDPDDYMDHLARSAREHGIEVPIIGCAGQGDLAGATGDADGVVPTVNLYPDDASTTFDHETRYYAGVLADRDLPLMVTETNRLHRTLHREILAGARLVAPYLQTSGFDHLVLPSAGNWGDPGNLMTHDYDFGGYISPDGRRRPEYDEAIALAATLEAWGERLATAQPVPLTDAALDGAAAGGALALAGGGHIVGPVELEGLERTVRLRPAGADGGAPVEATLAPGACPFWALDVPLAPWGSEGTLALATAELVGVERPAAAGADGALVLTFEGGDGARIELALPTPAGEIERLRLDGPGTARSSAASPAVQIVLRERAESRADPEPIHRRADGAVLPLGDTLQSAGTIAPDLPEGPFASVPGAEALGLADGRLQAEIELSPEAIEVLLLGAADLVRLELDGVDHGVQVTHGAPLSVPLGPGAPHRLRATAEIWGRANFDDARRPALALGAGRGMGTVLEVRSLHDVTDLWEVRRLPDRRGHKELPVPPLRNLGGWSSANPGAEVTYARTLPLPGADRTAVLRLHGLTQPVHVAIDGGPDHLVMPSAPLVVLGGRVDGAEITLRAPHVPGGLLDRAELLVTAAPRVREVRLQREAELAALLTQRAREAEASQWCPLPGTAVPPASTVLPAPVAPGSAPGLRVGAGAPVLIRLSPEAVGEVADGNGALLELDGTDLQVTVIAGGRRVSRHVLGTPVTAGGDPRRSWIPAGWREDGADEVLLLVEALAAAGGIFREVKSSRTVR
ncbi:MAG: beta-galactosidase [Brachybacterium sp.]